MFAFLIRIGILLSGILFFAPSAAKVDRIGISFGKYLFASSSKSSPAPIYLIVSAIWQGDHIRSHNVAAMQAFRRKFGSIPFTHFVSPAYFTRSNKSAQRHATMFRSVTTVNDEVGLILHPWQSIVKQSGVMFRKGPTFWGNEHTSASCAVDCGKDVPLAVYSRSDVSKLIATSMQVLNKNGLSTPRSFMAGGWMATPHVLAAAAAHGIKYDYSAVSQHLIRPKLEHYPLYSWVGEVWKNVTPHTQPFRVPTDYGEIIEVGNSAAMVDYLSTQQIVDLFLTYLAKKRANPHETLTFHIGFHQETALKYLPRLASALERIFAKVTDDHVAIRPVTLPVRQSSTLPEVKK